MQRSQQQYGRFRKNLKDKLVYHNSYERAMLTRMKKMESDLDRQCRLELRCIDLNCDNNVAALRTDEHLFKKLKKARVDRWMEQRVGQHYLESKDAAAVPQPRPSAASSQPPGQALQQPTPRASFGRRAARDGADVAAARAPTDAAPRRAPARPTQAGDSAAAWPLETNLLAVTTTAAAATAVASPIVELGELAAAASLAAQLAESRLSVEQRASGDGGGGGRRRLHRPQLQRSVVYSKYWGRLVYDSEDRVALYNDVRRQRLRILDAERAELTDVVVAFGRSVGGAGASRPGERARA